ncbi:SufD family Fe-S cluster assembly protein [bacterium]|nr:SufD family Fe-S cluster assembly protein [bacterium]
MTGLAEEALKRYTLPSRKDEHYRYVRLAGLNLEPSEGKFEVSGQSLVMTLEQAERTFGAQLQKRQERWLLEEKDPFALLNGGLAKEGVFVYVSPKTEEKLAIKHSGGSGMLLPRIYIHVGKSAKLHLRVDQEGKDTVNRFFDIILEENAEFFLHFGSLGHQQIDTIRASCKRMSRFKSVNAQKENLFQRQDYLISLDGEEASCELYGVAEVGQGEQSHTNVLVKHCAPRTLSSQKFKAVLSEEGRASFEGKIYVEKEAQKTEAYQISRYLLLSPRAQANSKPNLEIFADDVKASHGATVGQIDAEEIFYLQSRGLSRKVAEQMLIQGFVQEIYNEIS